MDFKSGDIIESSRWPEPIKIDLIETGEKLPGYIRIVGAGIISNYHVDDLITESEITDIKIKTFTSDFAADPESVFLSLDYSHLQDKENLQIS